MELFWGGGKLKLVYSLLIPVFFFCPSEARWKWRWFKRNLCSRHLVLPKRKIYSLCSSYHCDVDYIPSSDYCICSLFSFVVCCFSVFDPPLYVWSSRKWKTPVKWTLAENSIELQSTYEQLLLATFLFKVIWHFLPVMFGCMTFADRRLQTVNCFH